MRRAIGYELTSNPPTGGRDSEPESTLAAEAHRRGLALAWSYVDTGVEHDASPAQRPGLANAIGVLQPGDTLLIPSRRHIGADAVHAGMVERAVAKRGGRVVATDRAAVDPIVQAMSAAFAEYEAFLAVATGPAEPRRRRLPMAEAAGRISDEPEGRDTQCEAAVPAATEAVDPALAIIRGHVQAGWAAPDIADELNRRGCPAKDGGVWRGHCVRQIIEARGLGRLYAEPGFKRAEALATAPTGPRTARVDALLSTAR